MSTIIGLSITLEYPEYQSCDDKQNQFYIPGDLVEGVVVLSLATTVTVRGLHLSIIGSAHTSWENPIKKKTYEDSEIYLNHTEPLLEDRLINSNLPRGVHRFAFRFQLSEDLPSTFHGTYGSVLYFAKAFLETDDDLHNTKYSQPFLILRRDPFPLEAYQPVSMDKSKNYRLGTGGKTMAYFISCNEFVDFFKIQEDAEQFFLLFLVIKINYQLDHSCAVPGDVIKVNAIVMNTSGKDVTLIQGSVVLEGDYYAQGKSIRFREYLSKRQDFFDVNLDWGRRWDHVKVQVPPYLADSTLQMCSIMDIRYFFQFRVRIRGEPDVVMEAPLRIGYHLDDGSNAYNKNTLVERMMKWNKQESVEGLSIRWNP